MHEHGVRVVCNGGISALSAFFNGYGCSVAVDLPMEVIISEVAPPFGGNERAVERTLEVLKSRFRTSQSYRVTVPRGLPRGKGLKSSSAMTLSVTMGFLNLIGVDMGAEELLDLCADVSIENGTSLTGAYDDLCSCYYGGVCLTDNKSRQLIMRGAAPADQVLIAYSKAGRSSTSVQATEMARYARHADRIYSLIEEGLYYESMSMNGTLLGNIYGQNTGLIRHFLSSGAIYAAQCGKGPAVFGIFEEEEQLQEAVDGLGRFPGTSYKQTLFTNKAVMME